MSTVNPAWRLIILLLLLIISAISCQQPKLPSENVTENTSQAQQPAGPSENIYLESGFEIPQGTEPQRAETYDDIVFCQLLNYVYRANCQTDPNWVPGPDYIKADEVTLSGCEYAPHVAYRDHIETKAGEVRYNIFYVHLQDSSLRDEIWKMNNRTGKQNLNYEIKILGTCPDIQIKKIIEYFGRIPGIGADKQICLMIEISPQVQSGDYMLCFIVDVNGRNCGELPCVIHVTE